MCSWAFAYKSLWQTGQRIALAMLRGEEHAQERQDIVATPTHTVTGLLEKSPEARNVPPPLGDLGGMMKTIVRRRLLDHHRQSFRRTMVPCDEAVAAGLPPVDRTPDEAAQAGEVWRMIAQLDPPLPDLFTDRFLLGWTTTEIAERRGLNANTVMSHFHRGFARLRMMLARSPTDAEG